MGSRQYDLRTAAFTEHIQNVSPNPVAPAIRFPGDLFVYRNNCFGSTQIDNDVAPVYSLYDSVNDLSLSINKTFVHYIPLSILHLLNNDLLGRLGGNSAKGRCVHLGAEAVSYLTPRIEFPPLFHAYLKVGLSDLFHHVFELKNLNLTCFFIIMDFDINFGPKFLSGRRLQSLFEGPDQDFPVNTSITADLLNHPFHI